MVIIGYIHKYMYIYIFLLLHIYIYIYLCMCICIYVYIYACVYVYMYICTYVHMYICLYVYMYICICTYISEITIKSLFEYYDNNSNRNNGHDDTKNHDSCKNRCAPGDSLRFCWFSKFYPLDFDTRLGVRLKDIVEGRWSYFALSKFTACVHSTSLYLLDGSCFLKACMNQPTVKPLSHQQKLQDLFCFTVSFKSIWICLKKYGTPKYSVNKCSIGIYKNH